MSIKSANTNRYSEKVHPTLREIAIPAKTIPIRFSNKAILSPLAF